MSYFVTIAEETRKARKAHRCIWCGQEIPVGARYVYVRVVFEGDPQSNHFHMECNDASIKLAEEDDGEFMPFENERPPVLSPDQKAAIELTDSLPGNPPTGSGEVLT